jgi:hypothetical protein
LATRWINPWANGLAHKKPNLPWIIIFLTQPISWQVGSGLGRVYGSGLTSLEKMALKNTNSFVKTQQNDHEPQQLLGYLENIYGDLNIKARAARRLYLIQQREDQSFAKFLP